MIGMPVACNEAECHGLIRGALDLPRAEDPGGIAIQKQAQQYFGRVGFPTPRPILGRESREIKLGYAVYDETGQVVRWQTVAQPHRQIKCLIVVHLFECSTHALQYTIADEGDLLLFNKLLEEEFSSPEMA